MKPPGNAVLGCSSDHDRHVMVTARLGGFAIVRVVPLRSQERCAHIQLL